MTKILYIITQQEFGGAQRYIFDIATNLDKSQYEVHLAAGGSQGELFDHARAQNLAIHELKHLVRPIAPISDLLAYVELKKLISELKPDIVHLNSSKAGVLGSMAAKALNVHKIIYTAHGFVFNEPMSPIKRWLYTSVERGNAERADTIITVSEFDRESGIKAGMNENKIITIHNGIDAQNINFLPRDDARLSLRGVIERHPERSPKGGVEGSSRITNEIPRLGLASLGMTGVDTPLIGCIANFYETKGIDVLIDAMREIDAQLVIIGDGALRTQLENHITKLGLHSKIHLTGQIPSAQQYLKAFDLLVIPSRKEGLPYVLLEAAAAGIPIVATNVGGIPEIITDGTTGYLAQSDDHIELAQKINQALAHPLAPHVPDDCTLSRMMATTETLYRA
ncbi:hypothetical protein BK004_01200 [bacterium CG10_46_32]|nr:MAG: hypothetical protein BK004_01200 [bacterium CG10_46_32]PIR56315.1 MAG: hypothetical protein COU73_01215 [Parcubacteria group bacterium CG10_big_fil_rev_8_21_14_0_10_46_32]